MYPCCHRCEHKTVNLKTDEDPTLTLTLELALSTFLVDVLSTYLTSVMSYLTFHCKVVVYVNNGTINNRRIIINSIQCYEKTGLFMPAWRHVVDLVTHLV